MRVRTAPRFPQISSPAPARDLCTALTARLGLSACWFEPWPFANTLPRIERDRIVLPRTEVGARPYAAWRPNDGVELPVRGRGFQLGRFVLVPSRPTVGVGLSAGARRDALGCAERFGSDLLAVLEREGTIHG